jgi:hypothetical protein
MSMSLYLLGDSVSNKICQASLPGSKGDHEPFVGIKLDSSGLGREAHMGPSNPTRAGQRD